MQTPVVFLYGMDEEKCAQISRLCLPMKLRAVRVETSQYEEPLSVLAGLSEPTGKVYEGPAMEEEMLVMAGFSNAQLDAFLPALRKHKVPPVHLKAVMTPTNSAWTSLMLCEELQKERTAIAEGLKAHGKQPEA